MVSTTTVLSIIKIGNIPQHPLHTLTFLDASCGDSLPWAGNLGANVGTLCSAMVSTIGILGEAEKIRALIRTV